MSMITAKLGDICTIYTGTGFPVQYQGESSGDYPFFKVGDISKNVSKGHIYLTDCDNYISKEVAKKIKGTIVPGDTVVFAKIGEAVKLNRRAITSGNCLVDNNAMGICPDQAKILLSYFYHYMCSVKLEKYAEATTVPSVKKSVVEKMEIPLPSVDEQHVISDTLDRIDDLILLRKQQLSQLEELVKSRFIELFGDCVVNPKKWKTMCLEEIAEVGSSKRVFVDELKDTGIPFYRGTEIGALAEGKTVVPELFITPDHYEILCEATGKPNIGDLLMPSICPDGRIWVVNTDEPFYFKDGRVLWVHSIHTSYNSVFLLYTLKDRIMSDYSSIASGTTFAELKIFALKKCKVFDVPLTLQNEFAAFVEHTDKLKFTVRNTITIYTALILYFANFHWERRASVSNKGVKP